jgi:carboxyl-terminal processing protease
LYLPDGGSSVSSASEILLAGALQENNRAQLVGTKTPWQRLQFTLYELEDGAGLAVTIAGNTKPIASHIHKRGIIPNVEVVMTEPPLSC